MRLSRTVRAVHALDLTPQMPAAILCRPTSAARRASRSPLLSRPDLDTYYGFGPYAFQAIEGYDCPVGSAFMDVRDGGRCRR